MSNKANHVILLYMYEIEIKAHVLNRTELIKTLQSFADYAGAVERFDTYYGKEIHGKKVQVRIRKQSSFTPSELPDAPQTEQQNQVIFTYKRKEVRTDGKHSLEVNDEQECLLTDAVPFETFLADTGFEQILTKHKTVIDWHYNGVTLELCTIEKLGDFLELEIMSETNDEKQVQQTNEKLLKILNRCGISEDQIEKRYYSEMLNSL